MKQVAQVPPPPLVRPGTRLGLPKVGGPGENDQTALERRRSDFLVTFAVPAVAGASVSAPQAQQRIMTCAKGTHSLERQINVLLSQVSGARSHTTVKLKVMRASERVIRLNRRVVHINRVVLSSSTADKTILTALLALDHRLIKVDHATITTDRRAQLGHGSHLVLRVTTLATRMRALRDKAWRQRHALPNPAARPHADDHTHPGAFSHADRRPHTDRDPYGHPDADPHAHPTTSTPTPTSTPTTTPTPISGDTTITNQTFNTYTIPAGTHDVDYVDCTFNGGNASTAVLTLNQTCYDLTFTDCTVGSGPWNGVTINVTNGNIHDITFTGCHILAAGRMGIECTQRPASNTVGYKDMKFINDTIEPSAEEAMSFDGGYFAADSLIDGCTINGSDNQANPAYSGAIEINGPTYFTVQDTTIYACRKNAFNLEGPAGANGHLVFANDTVDYSVQKESQPTDASTARLTELQNVNDAVFSNCKFVMGHAWNAGYWTSSSGNDLSTSTLTGSGNGGSGFTLDSASTGNKLPGK